jgi:integrase
MSNMRLQVAVLLMKQVRKGAVIRSANLVNSFTDSYAGKSPSSTQQARIVASGFTYYYGHDPSKWIQDDIYGYLKRNEGLSRSTQYCYSVILRALLRFCHREDLAKLVKPPRRISAGKKYPTDDQVDKLFNVAETLLEKCVVQGLSHTGVRVGELVHLEVDDFDFEKRQISICAKNGWIPKEYKERNVPVDTKTASMVKEHIGDRTTGKIFPYSETWIRRLINDLSERAGLSELHITPHSLRHGYAVHALKHGMDLRSLQKILGHADLATTATYLQLTDRDVAEAYDKVFEKGAEA